MPGLLGIIQKDPLQDLGRKFTHLFAPMVRGGLLQAESQVDSHGHWAVGRVHLGMYQPQTQLSSDENCKILLHGKLHNVGELSSPELKRGMHDPRRDQAEIVRHLYRLEGIQGLSKLEGAFSAVILDESNTTLILLNDHLGSFPLYWHLDPTRLVFASELKALLRDSGIEAQLNPRAVADYLTFGFLMSEKTIAKNVHLLSPGSTLSFNWSTGEHRLERYAKLESLFQESAISQSDYYEALGSTFSDAVRQDLQDDLQIGLSLSGGLDSRAILSASRGFTSSMLTYTLGVKGCADEIIAENLANLSGTHHHFLEMDTTYLGDFLPNLQRMVHLTDGMYMTHGLTEILALRFIEKAGFQVLLRGHGAELAKVSLAWPLHTDSTIHGMKNKREFLPYMFNRVNYISRGAPVSQLFTSEWWGLVEGGAEQSLAESLEPVNLSPADMCSYLYMMEHHRRFTIPSLELFRNYVEVSMPFVNWKFLKVLWSGPAGWRDSTEIHRALIRQNHAALLKVRNSNTGAPGDANPLMEMVCDKINSLFKRLNVYGYRHYHAFEDWMRSSSIAAVEEILLDRRTLQRGYYQPNTLRRMLEETKTGRADYAYLFQILLTSF